MKQLPPYGANMGTKLLALIQREGSPLFTIETAKRVGGGLGLDGHAVRQLLHRMAAARTLHRLRRGTYVVADPAVQGIALHPFVVATHLVEPSAISHWSALAHHGLTDQIPGMVTATTTRRVVTPSMRAPAEPAARGRRTWTVEGVQYAFHVTNRARYFGFEDVWLDERFKVAMTDKDRTVLDTFALPERFGGLTFALTTLERHLSALNTDRLVAYAVRYGTISIAKRIGWALDAFGVPEESLRPLLDIKTSGYRLLDPRAKPSIGRFNPRWGLRENLPWKTASP